jgi:hypothetical protein
VLLTESKRIKPDTAKLRAQGFQPYRKTSITYARQMGHGFRVQTKSGDILTGAPGDYVAYSPTDDERWIVQRDIFRDTYSEHPLDTRILSLGDTHHQLVRRGFRPYFNHQITWARKIDQPIRVRTLEGEVEAHSGDYLCVGMQGEMWPQPGGRFESVYELVEGV